MELVGPEVRRHHAAHHRDIEVLPLAGLAAFQQRRQDAGRRVETGRHVGEGDPVAERLPGLRMPRADAPRHRRHLAVVAWEAGVRPRLSERRDAAIDHLGVAGPHRLVVDPEPFHHAGPVAFEDGVGSLHESEEDLAGLGPGRFIEELQGDAALVPGDAVIRRPHHLFLGRGVGRRQDVAPHAVARARLLDLDHVHAHVGEHVRRQRPRVEPGEVEHPILAEQHGSLQRKALHRRRAHLSTPCAREALERGENRR